MKAQFLAFLIRWILNSIGLWIAVRLLGSFGVGVSSEETIALFLLAGLIFSIVNTIVRPIVVILALPAILLTLGLFLLVVNGIMVYISLLLTPGLEISFGVAILAGIIMSLINYVVTTLLDMRVDRQSSTGRV